MVEVGVRDDDRVQRIERQELGRVEVGGPVGARVDPAVDQDLRVLGREEMRAAADLPVAAEGRVPGPQLLGKRVAGDPDPDLLQKRAPVVERVAQVDADLFDRLRRDRGCPDNGGDPTDTALQIVQHRAAPADRGAGIRGLDRDLAGLGLEEELVDLRLGRDQLPDLFLGLLGVDQRGGVAADENPAAEALGDLPEEVPAGEEGVQLLRVEDDVRAFQLDVGDLDVVR